MTTKKVTCEGAFKELQSVAWPRLLFTLDIDRTVEIRIAEECGADNNAALMEVLKHWLDNDEDASWEKLAKAVMTQPPFRRTGAYIYNKYVNNECLTADHICKELNFINDWFTLGYPFLYNSQKIKEAVSNVPVEARREKVMEVWLEFDEEPSWEKVARAIEDCFPAHEKRADEIRHKYLPNVKFRNPNEHKIEKLAELDSKSAFIETNDVIDWYALGWLLGLDDDDLNDVEKEHTRVDNRREAMLELWLKKCKTASWEILAKALRIMPQHIGLSQRIIERCNKKDEKQTIETQPATIDEPMDVESVEEEGTKDPLVKVDGLKSYIEGIQSAIAHSTPERVQQALADINTELDELKDLISQMRMTVNSEVATSAPVPISESILRTMELIDEYHAEFSSEKPFSLDWDTCGCKLHIPQGSIPPGEVCTLDVYAIYSGPFEFPENTSLVSAIYYVSLSHELLKPATLEIQHSCTIRNPADAEQLRFVTATATSGPPYSFRPIDGGYFNTSRYGFIRRTNFSPYAVVWELVKKVADYVLKRRKRSREEEEESSDRGGPSYAAWYFLIPIEHPFSWTVKLLLTKYTDADMLYFKKQQEREKKPVDQEFMQIILKHDTLSIAVLSEEEAKERKELKQWDGLEIMISNNWRVYSAVTQVSISELRKKISPCIKLRIEWRGEQTVEKANFRICLLGIESEMGLKIPVTVPHTMRRTSSLRSEPSFDGSDELIDPPSLQDWMNKVASRAPAKCDVLAYQLLPDGHEKFQEKTKNDTLDNRYANLFLEWQRIEGDNCSWRKIIDTLKMKSIGEISLSDTLETMYKD